MYASRLLRHRNVNGIIIDMFLRPDLKQELAALKHGLDLLLLLSVSLRYVRLVFD